MPQLSNALKAQIIALRNLGLIFKEIADQTGITLSTVQRTVKNYNDRGTWERQSGSG